MKKITLLTATALTIAGLGGQTLVAQAAPRIQVAQSVQSKQVDFCQNGNKVIISYGSGCDIQSALDQLKNCLPELNLPEDCFPNLSLPENCLPSIQLPGGDCPETDIPEADTPDADAPEADGPDTNAPGVDIPDVDAPEVNGPAVDTPETDVPGVGTPDNNGSGNNSGVEDTTPDQSPEEDSTADSVHAYVKEVIALVNAERAKEGLASLTMDKQVQAAAQVRAMECEQLFSHTRPNGTSFVTALQEQNVSYRRAGENIAWGQRTPQQVVTGWMNSEGHRANIMNPNFTTIGVGYYQNANGTNYWSQLFTS